MSVFTRAKRCGKPYCSKCESWPWETQQTTKFIYKFRFPETGETLLGTFSELYKCMYVQLTQIEKIKLLLHFLSPKADDVCVSVSQSVQEGQLW